MLDGCWMLDVGCWMVGESGIKANSAQFSWSLAELGNNLKITKAHILPKDELKNKENQG